MCGIAGLVDRRRRLTDERLRGTVAAMTDAIAHRGPDGDGLWADAEAGVGFGHRRLAIIDVSPLGAQPMQSACGRYVATYNGEIYNFAELRADLAAAGVSFRGGSDTEVVLEGFVRWGVEATIARCVGMFAFALWDRKTRTLRLIRDRMGVKPLYYAEAPEAFVYGSEVKSLFASGLVKPESRNDAVAEYLMFRQVAGDESMFRGVRSLPPGCTMTVRDGVPSITRYWSPLPPPERPALAFDVAVRELDALLNDSVALRLVSDVPVGTFCSGGVDSSLVTALAAKLKGDPINTFSVGFDESAYDESAYALMVSERYGTRHHRLSVGNVEFSDMLPKMVWHNDEPLDFANSIHIFALSRLAKQHVTVVLTGEGSDELFAGYPRYRIPDLATRYRWVPRPLRDLATGLVGDHRVAKLGRFAALSPDEALIFNSSYLPASSIQEICPALPTPALRFRRERLAASAGLGLDAAGRVSLLDQECFLVSILNRQDKMSMAASIESRVPFMDYRLVEFANRLSTSCKIVGGSGKAVVKAVARRHLPDAIVDRRKSGFGVPLAEWFREPRGLGERLQALVESNDAGVCDPTVLRRLAAEHRARSHDHSELLWTMLNLATWRETFRC